MFKPLLKSIPSLSGNMKIVCNLEGYNIDSSNKYIYNCNVNNAYLTSISSNLYDKNIPLNLKNNSFEYDIKKFYLYYADVFYKTNFNYSQINIPVIDFTSNFNNNNSDFKYGCKRVSYLKSGNQLAFYSPIYVESVDDLKGKYFLISCTFNNVYKTTKYIKIKISNINEGNNLADYLVRYAEKIDDKVIYCSNSYKNIYYGIDVRNGGFIKVEDNISSNLYNKYYTINDFDATINNGFKRNYMMMKQIIPLSFYFDPNNLLYDFEKNIYKNAEIIIKGRWYDENNQEIPFYDFSDDYSKFEEDIYNLYYEDKFKYISTDYNIMDIKYPGCNEASSENYKYVNTVAKNYNRWKLKYSDDLYPYIINNNYAFSFNQGSLYTYKEFPIMYSPIRAYAKLVSNTEYNMLFDYNDIYKKNEFTIINDKKKYFGLYNKNFISNFFDIFIGPNYEHQFDLNTNIDYSLFYLYNKNYIHDVLDNNDILESQFIRIPKQYVELNNLPNGYQLELIGHDYIDLNNVNLDDIDIMNKQYFDFYNQERKMHPSKYYIGNYLKLFYDKYISDVVNTENSMKDIVFNFLQARLYTEEEYQDCYRVNSLDENNQANLDILDGYIQQNDTITVVEDLINYVNSTIVNQFVKIQEEPEYRFFEITIENRQKNSNRNYWQPVILRPIIEIEDNIINIKWYKITKSELINKNTNDIIDIFADRYSDFWTNVNNDGKVYHKGILYDLNTIYNNNLNMNFKINKFSVFIKPRFEYTLAKDFNDLYKESKNVFSYNFTDSTNYYDLSQIYNYHQLDIKYSYLLNYSVVKKDDNGPYVDINSVNNIKKQYDKDNNVYFDINDIYIINLIRRNKKINLEKPLVIDDKEYYLSPIDGYKLIEVHNVKNILDDYFKDLIIDFNQPNKKNNDGIIFRTRKFIEIEDIYWGIDKLYFSIYPNKTKYSLINNYSLLKNVEEGINISLYYKTKFIKYDEDTIKYLQKVGIEISDINRIYKYFYSNGLYDRKSKILYTSPIFRQLNDLTNNYGQQMAENDKNIIYVDPYNLNKLYKTYLYKEYDCSNSDLVTYYCNFLNMDHIRLYFDKLYKDNELNGELSINNIYIKVRNFNNIIISLSDSENTNFSTITIQDDYIPISNFGLNNIGEISFYISYDDVLKCFYFNDDYINKFVSKFNEFLDLDNNDGDLSNEELCEILNLSSVDNETFGYWKKIFINLNKYNIKNFEICFKKDMLKLNEDLYNLIISRENDDIFKDLYLYHIQNPKDFKSQMHYIDVKKYSIDNNNAKHYYYLNNTIHIEPNQQDIYDFSIYISDHGEIEYSNPNNGKPFNILYGNGIDKTLVPYFKEIYEEGRTETNIYSDHFINNIIKTNSTPTRFRYNEPSINFLAYIPSDAELSEGITQSDLKNHRYTLINDVSDTFVTSSEFATYNVCTNPENLDEYSNLITYNYNGTYYGFYMINSYFDNTNNTINIQNEDLDYINCVDYINGIHVSKINEFAYSYLNGMYKNILPYFNTSNPLKFVMNNIDTLIKPQIYKLKNNIKQYPNIDGDYAYSYTLYNNKKDSYIELSRYFDNIVPYTPEVQYFSSYYLYYKDTQKIIENDLKIKRKPYIMYKENTNINKFSYISYFDLDKNIKKYEPTEYKYYNYNRFFNLEKEIVISIDQEFNEQGIIDFENDKNKIFELFVNYINNTYFDTLSNKDRINNYLFLYKKYEVKFIQDFKYIDSSNSKVYKLKIKFSLL